MDKANIKKILLDIRFWLAFFFLIRFIGITNAPLEIGHNWRQSLTNMIARNFLETGGDLFHPIIDMAGNGTGIIGSEFPIFNYLIYLVSLVFGYEHWYGRLINLIVSSLGIFYFYKLAKNIFNERLAFSAAIVLATSIWFSFSRKIMPDTFSVSLVLIALYCAYKFISKGQVVMLLLFFLLSCLGLLSKIPALSILSVIGVLLFVKEISNTRKLALLVTAFVSFLVASGWYFYWVPQLIENYKYQLYFPKGILEGLREIAPLIPDLLKRFYFSSLHSYVGFVAFLAGLYFVLKSQRKILQLALLIVTAVFAVFVIKTGEVFPLHNYYIIPFTTVMALVAGYFIARIPSLFQYALLLVIGIEGIANQQHDFFIKESLRYKLELESIIDPIIEKEELIVINGGSSPQDIYFSNRKGWTLSSDSIASKGLLDSLSREGAKYLILDRHKSTIEFSRYPEIFKNDNYIVQRLMIQD
jgi:hypothetical protein